MQFASLQTDSAFAAGPRPSLRMVANSSRSVIDPDVAAFERRMVAAGGYMPVDHRRELTKCVRTLKDAGIWDQIIFLAPFLGSNLACSLLLMKQPHPRTAFRFTNNGPFVEADYSPSVGLTSDGSTKYLSTTWTPWKMGSHTPKANHISVYCAKATGLTYSDTPETGILVNHGIYTQRDSGIASSFMAAGRADIAAPRTPIYGFYSSSRTGDRELSYYRGKLAGTGAIATLTLTTSGVIGVFGNGTGSDKASRTLCWVSYGKELTDGQHEIYGKVVEDLCLALGRSPNKPTAPTTSLNGVILIGQSLAEGVSGSPMFNPAPSATHLMFDSEVKVTGTTPIEPKYLIPFYEYPHAVGSQTVIGPMLYQIEQSDPSHVCLPTGCPKGGSSLVSREKGGTGYYEASMLQVGYAQRLATQGYKVRALVMVDGQSDESLNTATYGADLFTHLGNYDTDIKAITGQAEDVVMIYSQSDTWTAFSSKKTTPYVAQQALAAHIANPTRMLLACSLYHLVAADGIHRTGDSYRILGEYYYKVSKAVVIDGGTWSPLRPLSVVRSGADITIVFNKGGLVFDTSLVSDPAGTYASRKSGTAPASATDTTVTNKLGFEFCDDNATNPSAAISGFNGAGLTVASINAAMGTTNIAGDTLVVNLDGTPTSTNKRIRYAYSMTLNALGGPTSGPRGCLRDADNSVVGASGTTLYNYCVTFDEAAT